jgi:hypothetical protein
MNKILRSHGLRVGLLLLLVAWASIASAEDRALIIGIGTYKPGSGARNLPGIDRDVLMMRGVAQKYGFKESQIKVLMDSQATLEGMRKAFQEWLIDGVGPGDRALFYYSGHGAQVPDLNGDEEDGLDEVLVPYDVRVTDHLENVFIDDEIGVLLGKIRSNRVVVMLDSCHSGTATRDISDRVVKYLENPDPLVRVTIEAALTRKKDVGARSDATPFDAKNANYVAIGASTDAELSAATPSGSAFTVGLFRAVQAGSTGTSVRSLTTTAAAEIARLVKASDVHHPQLDGNPALFDQPLFAAAPMASPPGNPPPPVQTPVSLWDTLVRAANAIPRHTPFSGVQSEYRPGDLLQVSLTMPIDGYVNVINLGEGLEKATVLFPNRYVSDNHFAAGARVTLPVPGRFSIRLNLDGGKATERNLVVAFITSRPVNVYDLGLGQSAFRDTFAPTLRAAEIVGPDADAEWSALAEFAIRR